MPLQLAAKSCFIAEPLPQSALPLYLGLDLFGCVNKVVSSRQILGSHATERLHAPDM